MYFVALCPSTAGGQSRRRRVRPENDEDAAMRLSLKKAGALSTPRSRLQVDEALRPAPASKGCVKTPLPVTR